MKHVFATNLVRLFAASKGQSVISWPELSDLKLVFDWLFVLKPSIVSRIQANGFDRNFVGVVSLVLASDNVSAMLRNQVSIKGYLPWQSIDSVLDSACTSATKLISHGDTVIGIGVDAWMDDHADCLRFGNYTERMLLNRFCYLCADCNEATYFAALADCSVIIGFSDAKMDSVYS